MTESRDAPYLIYITAGYREEALTIARILVEEKLAACVNILGDITSFYTWENKLEETSETALIAKTSGGLVDRLTARVKSLHSYACPCVVATPIVGGNPAFLQWINTTLAAPVV